MTENSFGTGQANDNALPDPATLSYEQARDELVETVKILELGQMSLDESLKYWERGEAREFEELISTALATAPIQAAGGN